MEKQNVNRLGWIVATLASVSLAFAGIAAADSTTNPDQAVHQARKAALIAKYDTNGDGKLDKSERAAMRADFKAQILKKYDTNGDGKLDKTERAAMRADRATKLFAKMDTNKDGTVSLAEMQAFAATHPFAGHRFARRFGKHMHHGGVKAPQVTPGAQGDLAPPSNNAAE